MASFTKSLAKVVPALGSADDNERRRAAARAILMIRGMAPDLVVTCPRCRPSGRFGWRQIAARCLELDRLLTPWERGFIHDLRDRNRSLTSRQREILDRISVSLGIQP